MSSTNNNNNHAYPHHHVNRNAVRRPPRPFPKRRWEMDDALDHIEAIKANNNSNNNNKTAPSSMTVPAAPSPTAVAVSPVAGASPKTTKTTASSTPPPTTAPPAASSTVVTETTTPTTSSGSHHENTSHHNSNKTLPQNNSNNNDNKNNNTETTLTSDHGGLLQEDEPPPQPFRPRSSRVNHQKTGSSTAIKDTNRRRSGNLFHSNAKLLTDSSELLKSEIIDIGDDDDSDAPPAHIEPEHAPDEYDMEGEAAFPNNNHDVKNHIMAARRSGASNNPRASWTSVGVGVGDASTILIMPSLTCLVLFALLCVGLGATGTALGIYNTIDRNKNNNGGGQVIVMNDGNDDKNNNATQTISTLEQIMERGYIHCGTGPEGVPGFMLQVNNGNADESYAGLEVDLCIMLAAAIFNGQRENPLTGIPRFRITPVPYATRWQSLAAGEVDVLFRTTYNMERNVYEPSVQRGFEFSFPYFLDGVAFGGLPDHLACAEALDFNSTATCQETKICVTEATSHVSVLEQLLAQFDPEDVAPGERLADRVLQYETNLATGEAFPSSCQVMANEMAILNEQAVRLQGYTGEYALGNKVFSREPISMATNSGDARWSDFVEWLVQALIFAEEQGITKVRTFLLESTYVFGGNETDPHPQLEKMFENAIAYRGHYGELYNFNLQTFLPRGGMNRLNPGDSPIMYSFPFGNVDVVAPPLETSSPTVKAIKARGFLNCGISVRKGFAEFNTVERTWSGFDVELCRAISAALFDGVDHVVYTDLPAAQRFDALVSGRVDVLARLTTHTLSRDVKEPSTGVGLSFSSPYFHDGLKFGGLGTHTQCADNRDVISPECQDLKICVLQGTTIFSRVREIFQDVYIDAKLTFNEIIAALNDQSCNAVAGGFHDVALSSIEERGYVGTEPYTVGQNLFSKDPLALTTTQTDPLWSGFVRWIFWALVYAEENGIDQSTASKMPRTKLFGALRTNAFYHAVNAVGNYGELYNRNFNELVPRGGLHELNVEFGPMLRALPGISVSSSR